MKKISLLFMIAAIAIIMPSCGNKENTSQQIVPQKNIPQKTIPQKIQEANSVQEIKNLIDGTTWHYTENLSNSQIGGWLKVTFKNGEYITYYAQPSDGKWTEGGRGKYEVSEGRYSNTGTKYYAVSWKGDMNIAPFTIPCEMTMTMDKDGFQLNVGSSLMNGMNSLTMGIKEGAYYNATHKNVFTGVMEYGDYKWN